MVARTSKEARADEGIEESLAAAQVELDWLSRLPIRTGLNPLSRVPAFEKLMLDVFGHSEYGDFWRRVPLWEPHEYVDEYSDVPGFYVGGWYDMYREEEFFELLREKRSRIRVLIGPWTHYQFHRGNCGDVDFGDASQFSADDLFELQV